jgi:hypothetical protein
VSGSGSGTGPRSRWPIGGAKCVELTSDRRLGAVQRESDEGGQNLLAMPHGDDDRRCARGAFANFVRPGREPEVLS